MGVRSTKEITPGSKTCTRTSAPSETTPITSIDRSRRHEDGRGGQFERGGLTECEQELVVALGGFYRLDDSVLAPISTSQRVIDSW